MTADAPAPPRPRRGRLPRRLGWGLAILIAVSAISTAGIVIGNDSTNETPLHPENPTPTGVMAVTEVLAERQVDVRTITTHRSLLAADPGPDDTVVITSTSPLDEDVARRLVPALHRAGRVVIVADSPTPLDELELPVSTASGYGGALPALCSGGTVPPNAIAGLNGTFEITTSGQPDGSGWHGCFPTADGHAMMIGDYGSATAVVIGSSSFASNGDILAADNAQLALWLYGSRSELLWYMPDYNDTLGDPADEPAIAPAWFAPALVLLSFAVVTLMIARGRRFGPLTSEPLPVVVSALETTRTRGRLYRAAADLPYSAEVLRSGTVRRLARRLGLPAHATAEQVASLLAGKHPRATTLLTDPLPETPGDAVGWLRELRQLEDDVADD